MENKEDILKATEIYDQVLKEKYKGVTLKMRLVSNKDAEIEAMIRFAKTYHQNTGSIEELREKFNKEFTNNDWGDEFYSVRIVNSVWDWFLSNFPVGKEEDKFKLPPQRSLNNDELEALNKTIERASKKSPTRKRK